MRTDDFDFNLPEDRIALEPARPRDTARLLHVCGDQLADRIVRNLPDILRPGDRLVVNETRVIPAQLTGTRPARAHGGGGDVSVDITLHKQVGQREEGMVWAAFVRPAKRLTEGDRLIIGDGFEASVLARDGAEATLLFPGTTETFSAGLRAYGKPPLPPYIARKRGIRDEDHTDYQTTYAARDGSVAAPTAGLHFTPKLMAGLEARGIGVTPVLLHVGAGTFLPVTADDIRNHKMHSEWGMIPAASADAINRTRIEGGRIICVGTTSLRLVESAARLAPEGKGVAAFEGETDIFITPGFDFRVTDLLMTNFHLPRSTLFMLVCAFAGTQAMKAAYTHAIDTGYRFYSYGDACLLERG